MTMTQNKAIGVIDSPANQKQISKFENEGFVVLRFPQLTIQRIPLSRQVEEIAGNVTHFDLLIVTDIHSADSFIGILEDHGVDLFSLDGSVICALGEAVVDRFRFVQIHSDIVPANKFEKTVLESIANYFGDKKQLSLQKVLLVKGEEMHCGFSGELMKICREFREFNVYAAEKLPGTKLTRLNTLLENGAVDEFIFFSVEDVESFIGHFGREQIKNAEAVLTFIAAGPAAYQSLRENGLTPKLTKFV
ncbi:MAG: uroporphyrinogen-III synthase [Pyrinomonadaceae bacterium]